MSLKSSLILDAEAEEKGKKINGYQVGEAVIGSGANGKKSKCPSGNVGKGAQGRANGCAHTDCTTAKNNARAALRAQIPAECTPYIQSTRPCKKIGC